MYFSLRLIKSIVITVIVFFVLSMSFVYAQNITVSENFTVFLSGIGRYLTILNTSNALDQLQINDAGTSLIITTAAVSGSVIITSAEGLDMGGSNNSSNIALTSCTESGSRLTITASASAAVTVTITPANTICSASSPPASTGSGGISPAAAPAPAAQEPVVAPGEEGAEGEGEGEGEELPPEEAEPLTAFEDVLAGHWAESAVSAVYEKGIMLGKSKTKFDGAANTLRAEMAAIVLRTLGESCGEEYSAPFKDVDQEQWYAPCISKAYEKNIMIGDKGLVRPADSVKRAEIIAMFFRAFNIEPTKLEDLSEAELDEVPFNDFNKDEWWAPYIYDAYMGEILFGYSNNTVRPEAYANRFEIAVITIRFLNYFIQF